LCLFLSLTNDTHILALAHVISIAFNHFASLLVFVGLSIQLCKCSAWAPSSLPHGFILPTKFYCPLSNIKILGVPFGSISFTSSFLQEVLGKDVWHVNVFLILRDVYVTFDFFLDVSPISLLFCFGASPLSRFLKSTCYFLLHPNGSFF